MKQLLRIEIDTAHPSMHGNQSPQVANMLHTLADHFESKGVQMTKYPHDMMVEGFEGSVFRMDLIESGESEDWEPVDFSIPQERNAVEPVTERYLSTADIDLILERADIVCRHSYAIETSATRTPSDEDKEDYRLANVQLRSVAHPAAIRELAYRLKTLIDMELEPPKEA